MDIEPTNDQVFVDPNTDDLDAFDQLMTGEAQATPDEVKEDEVKPDEVEQETDDEVTDTDTDADDSDEEEAPDGDADTEVDEAEEKDEPVKKPKVSRYQERINELTAKAREAERALEALKEAQTKQSEPVKPTTPVVQEDGPDPSALKEDGTEKYPLGEFDPEYIRDMARHTINKEWEAKQEQEAQANLVKEQEQQREALHSQWVEKLAPVTEVHDDFVEKTMGLENAFDGLDPDYSDYIVQTIKSLDHGPEVLYYFANNLAEAEKFIKAGPLPATLALGEINAMFKGQTRKTDPKVSKAPPPPQVNKGKTTRKAVAADTDDLDAFTKLLMKK